MFNMVECVQFKKFLSPIDIILINISVILPQSISQISILVGKQTSASEIIICFYPPGVQLGFILKKKNPKQTRSCAKFRSRRKVYKYLG